MAISTPFAKVFSHYSYTMILKFTAQKFCLLKNKKPRQGLSLQTCTVANLPLFFTHLRFTHVENFTPFVTT
jgi:hypothetical protein